MLFENKTNSLILDQLEVAESTLKCKYMKESGMGLDLLEALHTYISPEELFKYGKVFGISKLQIQKLKDWLESDCFMAATMKKQDEGYGFISRSLFDNGSWGILTKIRRHVIDWEPYVENGYIKYKEFNWLTIPFVEFENEDTILFRRAMPKGVIPKWSMMNTFHGIDSFYEQQLFCFKRSNGCWRKGTLAEKLEAFDAKEIMKLLAA